MNQEEATMAGVMTEREPLSNVSAEALIDLKALKQERQYAQHEALFLEGDKPDGVYVVRQGRVNITISGRGKRLLLRTVSRGEVLGLSSAISDRPFEATAEAATPCVIDFIDRGELVRFMRENRSACLEVLQYLSSDVKSAHEQVKHLAARHKPSRVC
jgi:CRP-like cAMP-binding protein